MRLPGKSAWLALSLAVILLDQLTKWFVASRMAPFESVYVLPVFNIALLHNTGAAFSMLASASGWQRWLFVSLALVVAGFISAWLARMPASGSRWSAVGLALVAGGAVGNVIDRLVQGYVVDFLQFHWQGWYFPAFNAADSAITVGAAILVLEALFLRDSNAGVK